MLYTIKYCRMKGREEIWVVCESDFVGRSGYKYRKGVVYRGYKKERRYFLLLLGSSRTAEISEPGKGSACFNLVDPFLVNSNKVLE